MGLILVSYYTICHQQTTSTQINLCIFKTQQLWDMVINLNLSEMIYEVWRNEENHFWLSSCFVGLAAFLHMSDS